VVILLILVGCELPTDNEEVVQVEPPKQVELSARSTVDTTTTDVVIERHVFRVTAYCSCAKCCGKWANNRPLDSNGNPIVIGASGDVLIPMVSVASPLPFGTEIDLQGVGTVVVHDRTAQWIVDKHGQYIVDLYFNDHQKALDFGVRYLEGEIKK
jgi:3D (Asp-Asp-Asp) domain-containing protein